MTSCAADERRGQTSANRNERLFTVNAPTDCGDPSTNGWLTQFKEPELQLLSHRQTSDRWLTNNQRALCVSLAGTRTPQPTKQTGTQPLPDNRHKLHTRTHYLEQGQPTVATPLHSTNKPPAIGQPVVLGQPAVRNTRNPNVITLARFLCSKRAYTNYQFKLTKIQSGKKRTLCRF